MHRTLVCIGLLVSSCAKQFLNPYDSGAPSDAWMPHSFIIDTLGSNQVRLRWQQDELHIDGYVVRKEVAGRVSEYEIMFDSLQFTDLEVIDSLVADTCPIVSYQVMARAGDNRSLAVGTNNDIFMPLSLPVDAGEDIFVTDTTTIVKLAASSPSNGESGWWSVTQGIGGAFSDPTAPDSEFIGNPCGFYMLRWTVYGCNVSWDQMQIQFNNSLTQADAGSNQFVADTTQTTLNGNSPSTLESGNWTIVSGSGGSISDPSFPSSTFSGLAGTTYTLQWTISGCGISNDQVVISFSE